MQVYLHNAKLGLWFYLRDLDLVLVHLRLRVIKAGVVQKLQEFHIVNRIQQPTNGFEEWCFGFKGLDVVWVKNHNAVTVASAIYRSNRIVNHQPDGNRTVVLDPNCIQALEIRVSLFETIYNSIFIIKRFLGNSAPSPWRVKNWNSGWLQGILEVWITMSWSGCDVAECSRVWEGAC